jgi:hypothetical protein
MHYWTLEPFALNFRKHNQTHRINMLYLNTKFIFKWIIFISSKPQLMQWDMYRMNEV